MAVGSLKDITNIKMEEKHVEIAHTIKLI